MSLTSDVSSRGESVFDYIITLQESSKLIKTRLSKPGNIKEAEAQIVTLKSKIDSQLNTLSTSTPPPALSRFHLELVDAYSKTSKKLSEIVSSLKKKNYSVAGSQLDELSVIANSFSKIAIPSESKLITAILPKADQSRLEKLSGRIDSENAKLQKTFFIF